MGIKKRGRLVESPILLKNFRAMKNKKLKIAVIAPPFMVVPPKGQGGTERIVYQMVEEFTKRGHKVTLFGAGKCKTSAKFVQIFKETISERKIDTTYMEASRNLRLESVYIASVMKEILKRQQEFDIVFNHMRGGYLFLPLSDFLKIPVASILHLPIFEELGGLLSSYKKTNIITISNNQRTPAPKINYLATVYNGVDLKEFEFCQKPKDYFLFIGALGEHKNPKAAILAAKKTGSKLILAGGKKREPYFSKEIKPLIDGKQIKYVKEVSSKKRIDLYKNAKALLFPIKWQEPFGLVMIEAMACGTPVIGYNNASVPEVVKDGKTGFVVDCSVSGLAKGIKKIDSIKREDCRKSVEDKFSIEKMIDGYERVCRKLVKNS